VTSFPLIEKKLATLTTWWVDYNKTWFINLVIPQPAKANKCASFKTSSKDFSNLQSLS
jgi:hypothetical protein